MCIHGLAESKADPDVHRQDVKIGSGEAVEEGTTDCPLGEDEDFKRVRVLRGLEGDCKRVPRIGQHCVLVR